VTIDHESTAERTVTLRERDSLQQQRVPIDGLAEEIEQRLAAPWQSPKLAGS
jgi:glycyl-tRNA synthetase